MTAYVTEIHFYSRDFYLRDVYYIPNCFFGKLHGLSKDIGILFSSRPYFWKTISKMQEKQPRNLLKK